MNLILLIINVTWLFLSLPIDKQNIPDIEKHKPFSLEHFYIINHAILDSVDYSEHYQNVNGYIKFYQPSPTEKFYMANVMPKEDTQSFGEITDLETQKEFIDGELVEIANFKWHFKNSYDDISGEADVIFYTTMKDSVHQFVCLMNLENGEFSIFSGPVLDFEKHKEVKP
ncbi:MAG: hypothetical protein IPN79_15225 [Saprospiraceae bacterium]|nr:hypothetical protein [Saprospiraceae bacterium]